MWIRKDQAFQGSVDPGLFFMARGIVAARCRKLSDEEMLQKLKELQDKKGYLSAIVIDEAEDIRNSQTDPEADRKRDPHHCTDIL